MTEPRLDPPDATDDVLAAGRAARPTSVRGPMTGAAAASWALGVLVARMLVAPDPLHIDPFGSIDRPARRRSMSRAA